MTNKSRVLGLVGLCTKAGKITFGTQACLEAIKRQKLKLVIVAVDAADRTKQNFQYQCEKRGIAIRFYGTIEEISKAIGQNNKAVIGMREKNLSDQIIKIVDGGDVIG